MVMLFSFASTASTVALVGGGTSLLRPGEASLATNYSYLNPSTDDHGRQQQNGDVQFASKSYGEVRALDNVSLNVAPREFVSLFRSGLHSAHETPDVLPDWLERGARHATRSI